MLDILNTLRFDAMLAEGPSDITDLILTVAFFVVVGLVKFIAGKITNTQEKKEVEETQQRIDARRAQDASSARQGAPDGSWQRVKSTPAEIQAFLDQARQRAEQRKRKRMMRKKGYHVQTDDVGADILNANPLPSATPQPAPPPIHKPAAIPITHREATRRVEELVVEAVEAEVIYTPPQPAILTDEHDYNDCDETHRIVADIKQAAPAARHVMFGLDNADSLKKAVIFSEILGRPKSLQQNMGAWEFPC